MKAITARWQWAVPVPGRWSPKTRRVKRITAMRIPDGHRPMSESEIRIGTMTRGMELAAPVVLNGADLAHHLYLIGATGTGKSTLLKALLYDDLVNGRDFALLDPLGGLADAVTDAVPIGRTEAVIYWSPGGDLEHCIGFNPLFRVARDRRHLVADGVVASFMHTWDASLEDTPRLAYVLYNATRLLLDDENDGATLLGLSRLLVDDRYRARLLKQCRDPIVRSFWENEFAAYDERFRVTVISSVQNKVGLILSPPALRNVLGQHRSTLDLRRLMNDGGSLICNLAKGLMGEIGTRLLGSLIATSIAQVAQERASIPVERRRPFALVTDELQNYVTPHFAAMLSESRQLGLRFAGAHQFLGQLPALVSNALIANAASKIVYRVSSDDGRRLAQDLDIENPATLSATPNHQAWCKLLRHGVPTDAMLVDMLDPEPPARGRARALRRQSNALHTRPRAIVEAEIARFLAPQHESRRARR